MEELIGKINLSAKIARYEERIRPVRSEVNRLLGSNEKIMNLIDWKPKYTFEQRLTETIEFLRNNLKKYKSNIYSI